MTGESDHETTSATAIALSQRKNSVMNIISQKELEKKMEAGPVALFDVRGDVDYEIAHIPGAKTAPLGSLVFRVASVMDDESFIVLYSSKNDRMAEEAAERLAGLRHENVWCLENGIDGWIQAGHDVMASPSAKKIAQGPVIDCRPIVVDVENAYGGAFKTTVSDDIGGAGG
jgi:rhodanese-related sulfurtransferase